MPDTISRTEHCLAEDTYTFCMEHMQEHFLISFLAARAGVSPTKLKTVFRRVYGAPLFSYIRKKKLHWAADQLANSNVRILNLAEACGYDNASKFSAAFRAEFGTSPREYRKNVRLE